MVTAFVGGTVIDGTGNSAQQDMTIVVEGTKITDVSRRREFGPEVRVIDVSGKTVMPGLIDCHMHFGVWYQWLITYQDEYLMFQAAKTAYSLRSHLEAGCTASRDHGGLEAGFVQAVTEGLIPGPRLQTALVIIQPTNGLMDHMPGMGRAISPQGHYAAAPAIPTPWCDGPWEARAKVREVLRYGADFIKIASTAHPVPVKGPAHRLTFSSEEIEAIVHEAHEADVPVCCHSTSIEGTLRAVRAGVDTIEHGTVLNEECVEEMVKRGTWLCPMFTIIVWHANHNPDERVREVIAPYLEEMRESFALAVKGGVRIAMGTDAATTTGTVGIELKHMCDSGMTPMQSIVASAKDAAEYLGMNDDIGTLESGKEADLLVVDGNPLENIAILSDTQNLSLVMQAGRPMAGPMVTLFPWQPSAPSRAWI
jgi:imidazolonepropionase-like amidohydrolase